MSSSDSHLSRRTFLTGLTAAGAIPALIRAEPSGAASPTTTDKLLPARSGDVKLRGYLGGRIDQDIRSRVMAQDVEKLVQPFRDRTEVGDGDWRCEYWGKWLTSAVLACDYQRTPGNRAVVDRAVAELIATQSADGYIGTRKLEHRLKGWDVWGRKYVLLGLLAYYDLSGSRPALQAACRHADALLAECGPGKANIAGIGYPAWKGLPPSSILEPMVLLYRRTHQKRYLEFAEYIVGQWSKPSALTPKGLRLVEQALAKVPVAKIDAPKAYEQTSCFEGLCELYRATGNPDYLAAVRNVAENIIDSELFIVGSGCNDELWFGGHTKQALDIHSPMETCVTATWMKYAYQLLRLTGDSRYGDQLEVSLYNALLGALKTDGSWWTYFTPLHGYRSPSEMQHADVGLSCCVASGPRALMLTPRWAVMTDAAGPVVNLYCQGSATVALGSGNRVRIEQATDYPVTGTVRLTVTPERAGRFTLKLRVPAWSSDTELTVNGNPAAVALKPGAYAAIARPWRAGDRVELRLDMSGRVFGDPGDTSALAVMRGPIVLAWDKRFGAPGAGDPLSLQQSGSRTIELTPVPAAEHPGIWMAFAAPLGNGATNRSAALTLCDFASAGNTWSKESEYRVWLPQPVELG